MVLHPLASLIYSQIEDIYLTGGIEMTRTLLDLDEELLNEATTALGTSTKKETVTVALRNAVDESRKRRAAALERLQEIADRGGFDFDRLDELDE